MILRTEGSHVQAISQNWSGAMCAPQREVTGHRRESVVIALPVVDRRPDRLSLIAGKIIHVNIFAKRCFVGDVGGLGPPSKSIVIGAI